MKLTGNTIFITGGGTGIGRGLAEALHAKGNQVIISGRRKDKLAEVVAANAGMDSVELDVADAGNIASVAKTLLAKYPKLNVVINNAGIGGQDDASVALDPARVDALLATNVVGPLLLTSALIEHLKSQQDAVVAYVTSGLAFLPLARGSVYSATKAFLHSYILSQRYMLRGKVSVLEIAPPYVQTELGGEQQKNDPRAMPLDQFIDETMQLLGTDAVEVLTENVKMLRNNVGPNEGEFFTKFNDMMAGV